MRGCETWHPSQFLEIRGLLGLGHQFESRVASKASCESKTLDCTFPGSFACLSFWPQIFPKDESDPNTKPGEHHDTLQLQFTMLGGGPHHSTLHASRSDGLWMPREEISGTHRTRGRGSHVRDTKKEGIMYRIADQEGFFKQVILDHLTTRKDETHEDPTDTNS
jgi:hypothetical protein